MALQQMKIRRVLFLSLGLGRVCPPHDRKYAKETTEKLIEPDGARVCRRNILALAAVVVLTSAAGASPRDLDIFGVTPNNDWGVLVLGATVILVHLYWYVLRYYHLWDDGKIELNPQTNANGAEYVKINRCKIEWVRRGADLFANWAAFVLTCLSWLCIGLWIFGGAPR